MIKGSFDCAMTTTEEGLRFFKKQVDTFKSSKVEIELNSIDLIEPLLIGDIVSLDDCIHVKIDSITDKKLIGHTVITKLKDK